MPSPPPGWQPERFGHQPLALLNHREERDKQEAELRKQGINLIGDGSSAEGAVGTSADGGAEEEEEEDPDYQLPPGSALGQPSDCSEGDTDECEDECMAAWMHTIPGLPFETKYPWLDYSRRTTLRLDEGCPRLAGRRISRRVAHALHLGGVLLFGRAILLLF